jgi:hypothetical protein
MSSPRRRATLRGGGVLSWLSSALWPKRRSGKVALAAGTDASAVLTLRDGFFVRVEAHEDPVLTVSATVLHASSTPIDDADAKRSGGVITLVYDGDAPKTYAPGDAPVSRALRLSSLYNKFDARRLPASRGICSSTLRWLGQHATLDGVTLTLEASGNLKLDPQARDEAPAATAESMSRLVAYYERHYGVRPLNPRYLDVQAMKADVMKSVAAEEMVGVSMGAPLQTVLGACAAAGAPPRRQR